MCMGRVRRSRRRRRRSLRRYPHDNNVLLIRPSTVDPPGRPSLSLMYYRRKNIRLPGKNYTEGTYFVTLSVPVRANVFGRIVGSATNAKMELNGIGRIVDE